MAFMLYFFQSYESKDESAWDEHIEIRVANIVLDNIYVCPTFKVSQSKITMAQAKPIQVYLFYINKLHEIFNLAEQDLNLTQLASLSA